MKDHYVYKYAVDLDKVDDFTDITMPKGSIPISVVNQHEKFTVYALVPATLPPTCTHRFRVVGTGYLISREDAFDGKFMGTLHFCRDSLMFHIWYMGEL